MKKLWTLMAMVAVFASCSQEEADSPLNTYTLTGYADVESRTAFGTPGATSIPFQWSAGDYIYLGSTKSNTINNSGSNATFTFGTKPSATDVYYNISGSSAKEANVKAEQTVGNLGKNGDFGYATINNNSFTLNHATSYVWFDTTLPDGATLESITLNAGTTKIAGTATWDGSNFGTVSNASSSISLPVNKTSANGAELSIVIFPSTITDASVTYNLKINGTTKSYTKIISGSKQIPAGKTWKISTKLFYDNNELYELRVLTFEDEDAKFEVYPLDYADDWSGREITTWSDLIDNPQYGGPMLYGNGYATTGMSDAAYYWYDEGNTKLYHMFPDNGWGGMENYNFAGGGHAISNYWGAGYTDKDRNIHIAKYYGQDYIDQWTGVPGADAGLGWFCVQLMTPIAPHSGNNFAVHYGYKDGKNYIENLPEISFADGQARVIDHMYVTNTNYTLNQLYNGVKSEEGNTFGGNWTGLTEDAWLKIVAQGFDDVDADAYAEPISEVEFYLVKGLNVVETWQKWDLSGLGAVAKVRFNFLYSPEMGGKYGFTIPGYFAYDDIAVRF